MSHTLIRLPEVQRRTGYSKAWIYRLLREQRFPQSVKIGSRSIAFVESEADKWISQRIEERDALIATKSHL
ncbi:helix-turn-helix transcriptional regulator [Cronobacter malonaticus]